MGEGGFAAGLGLEWQGRRTPAWRRWIGALVKGHDPLTTPAPPRGQMEVIRSRAQGIPGSSGVPVLLGTGGISSEHSRRANTPSLQSQWLEPTGSIWCPCHSLHHVQWTSQGLGCAVKPGFIAGPGGSLGSHSDSRPLLCFPLHSSAIKPGPPGLGADSLEWGPKGQRCGCYSRDSQQATHSCHDPGL